nr:ABC transporter ATP-binding protein [Feifania hominis]
MKTLKYLKKSWAAILLIVALLAVQATCDLSLPSYTSDIVNVGIQQGGIEFATPEVARASTMENLLLFVSDADRQEILSHYELLDQSTLDAADYAEYVKKYPALGREPLYLLRDRDMLEELSGLFDRPMLLVAAFDGSSELGAAVTQQMMENLPPELTQNGAADPLTVLKNLPDEMRRELLDSAQEQLAALPDTIVSQSAVTTLKGEYEAIGVDVGSMQTRYIVRTGLTMLGIALIALAATVSVGFLAARVAASLGRELRRRVFEKVVSFSSAEMDRFSTASLITRSTNDIQQVQMLMVMLLRIVFYAPILGVGGVVKALGTNASMAWIIAVAVMTILMLVMVLFSLAMPRFNAVQRFVDRLNLVTREILTGLPVIRAFSTEKHEEQRFDRANRDLTRTQLFVNRLMACMMPVMMLVMNGVTLLIVWFGSHSIDGGLMQVGDMMAFIQYTMQIIMAFLMISVVSVMLPRAAVSARRVDEIISAPLSIRDPKAPKTPDAAQRGVVTFDHVSFRYPGAEENVLTDISFTARPGQTTAIIGSTGSGKSTLVSLIPRFYDATEGSITVDGVDVREMSQHQLRDLLGYVPQKGVLFSGTIASNIDYSGKSPEPEQIKRAAAIAQATEFIDQKPEGYDSEISQGGTNVSGGQKQRLSIARAIAGHPEIYLFDDSFSALDFKTDVALRRALAQETGDSTVIIVAQRISTILNAEQILVLDEGRIVGRGTHQQLLESCEEYRQIALSQLSKEELSK